MAVPEVDVLDPEPEAFKESQTAAIQQMRHEPVIACQVRENGAGFSTSEDDRELRWAADTLHARDGLELPIEHLLVKEEQCAESLILSRSGDARIDREVAEELGDLLLTHFRRVALPMEENKALDPIDVRLLGADTVALHAQVPAHAVEQARRRRLAVGSR